ncbi:hypothetical protein HDR61_03430 [bacterium]|nr:hypothetical protein [bacterium]
MKKIKPIDDTAARLGIIMCNARRRCHLSHDDASKLLNIMPNELLEYERGIAKIPADVLERAIVLGYQMMRINTLESIYKRQRNVFRKLKAVVAEMP